MLNYLFNFEKPLKVRHYSVFYKSLNEFAVKIYSLPGSKFQCVVTICIDSIHIRLNSLVQTKYRSYLRISKEAYSPNDNWQNLMLHCFF